MWHRCNRYKESAYLYCDISCLLLFLRQSCFALHSMYPYLFFFLVHACISSMTTTNQRRAACLPTGWGGVSNRFVNRHQPSRTACRSWIRSTKYNKVARLRLPYGVPLRTTPHSLVHPLPRNCGLIFFFRFTGVMVERVGIVGGDVVHGLELFGVGGIPCPSLSIAVHAAISNEAKQCCRGAYTHDLASSAPRRHTSCSNSSTPRALSTSRRTQRAS